MPTLFNHVLVLQNGKSDKEPKTLTGDIFFWLTKLHISKFKQIQ